MKSGSDLCCYWFEKSRAMIEVGRAKRAGLLATQGIRGGANSNCLKRILETGDIFFAVSDKAWVLDGANVHISMVGFDDGSQQDKTLDGNTVTVINSDLTALSGDLTTAQRLTANQGIGFIGTTKKAPLDLPFVDALAMLHEPNPHGRPNSDVLLPYLNTNNVTKRIPQVWIIDYGSQMSESVAAYYAAPFQHVRSTVYPLRVNHREPVQQRFWWRLARPCPDMFTAIAQLPRFLITPTTAKHRIFVWESVPTHPDHQLVVFARSDDYFLGVLHSRIHEVWSLKRGTRLETRPRYTPTTCFETFPFPEPTAAQRNAIASAAKELDTLRTNWLNPPEWTRTEVLEFPGSADGPWKRYVQDVDPKRGVGTVRYPRTVPKDAAAATKLKARMLTNLYNESPAWLTAAHRKLDEAVFAAYGWPADLSDDALLAKLLELNLSRAGAEAAPETDEE